MSTDGKSAYQIAVLNGYVGTEEKWLESLIGSSAYLTATLEGGFKGTKKEWIASLRGQSGISAYDVAVANGYKGSEKEWLESLVGKDAASTAETLPTKTGQNQQQVNDSYNNSLINLKSDIVETNSRINASSKGILVFSKEEDLLKEKPTTSPIVGKAYDTRKEWIWEIRSPDVVPKWWDTGVSDLDLAKENTRDELSKIAGRELGVPIFQVEDAVGNISLKQAIDAHVYVPHIDGSIQQNINQLQDRTGYEVANDIAQFQDADGNTTFRQKTNGDIVWAGSYKTLNEHFEDIDSKISQTHSDDAAVIYDNVGNKIAVFTSNQDLKIGQVQDGIGSKLNSEQLTSKTSDIQHSNYFLMREDAAHVVASMSALNPVLRAPVPLNYVPLSFEPPAKFLNMQIEQHEMIKLNTVYQDDDGVVHPHIIEFYDKFNGAKYWLGITGYYLTQDKFENPFLFGSNDLKNFKMFNDYPQPLVERPVQELVGDHQYNSDIFQFYDFHNGELCVGFRTTRKKGKEASRNSMSYRSTKDGKNWSDVRVLVNQTDGTGSDIYLSPSIIYDFINKKYLMYVIDGENRRYELVRWECRFLGDAWVNRTVIDTPRHFTPWHCDVRYCGNKVAALIQDNNDSQNIYLGFSGDNGTTFEFGNPILTGEFHKPYKATFLPVIDEYTKQIALNFLWTSRNLPENPDEKWRLYSQKTNFINLDSE